MAYVDDGKPAEGRQSLRKSTLEQGWDVVDAHERPDGLNGHGAPPAWATERVPDAPKESFWPAPIDLEALSEQEPDPPAFIMPDWLPCGYATLFAGHGGVGKSGLALRLAVCMALGVPFFGIRVEPRRVLYLSCEDRENVLHWRLRRICDHLGCSMADLRGKLDILDLVGRETILWERDNRTGYTVTPAFGELAAQVKDTEREVLFVDGVSDTFGGNENNKTEVKRYVNALVGLIPPDTGAVPLIGHVSKPTANQASSEGYSGTTGWHNAVRARWYLYPESKGDEGRTGDLLLELQKSNLGRTDQEMRLTWDDQAKLFTGQATLPESHLDRKIREDNELQGVIDSLKGSAAAGVIVPAATTGNRTAFHVLSSRPEFASSLKEGGKPAVRRFWRLIEQLRHQGRLTEVEYKRPNSHKGTQLVLK